MVNLHLFLLKLTMYELALIKNFTRVKHLKGCDAHTLTRGCEQKWIHTFLTKKNLARVIPRGI